MSHLNMSLPVRQRLVNWREFKAGGTGIGSCYKNYMEESPSYSEDRKSIWFNGIKAIEKTWRFTDYADKIISLQHTGWFADTYCDDIYRGVVVQLPARNGEYNYLAGYISSDTDEVRLTSELYHDKEEAARGADHLAEKDAEESKEFRTKDQAEQRISELRSENKETRKEIATLKRTIVKLCDDIRRNKAQIAKLEENYWTAVE